MAVYKVPQDVEAEDKLLGPFSFRQFVYLIIAGGAGFIAWLLWSIAPFLVILPVPVIVFFVVLALPLRKDQPMEIYLLAVVQFLLKPKKRLWSPDGIISLVQITPPQATQVQLTKNITESEASNRLAYLAQVMDTRGWASRGVDQPVVNQSLTTDAAYEAQSAKDILDNKADVSQSFDSLIEKQAAKRREEVVSRMQGSPIDGQTTPQIQPSHNPYDQFLGQSTEETPSGAPSSKATESNSSQQVGAGTSEHESPRYNPYPTAIRQQVIQPIGSTAPQQTSEPAQSASTLEVSPDIINLANNSDLSISTIANEARRIQEKKLEDSEVEISLR